MIDKIKEEIRANTKIASNFDKKDLVVSYGILMFEILDKYQEDIDYKSAFEEIKLEIENDEKLHLNLDYIDWLYNIETKHKIKKDGE